MTPMIRPGILRECLEEVERKAAWGPPNPIGTGDGEVIEVLEMDLQKEGVVERFAKEKQAIVYVWLVCE